MFAEIITGQLQGSKAQDRCWLSHDSTGNAYTLTATALGHKITRVVLRRGAAQETQRYQLASGTGGTLPYHSWIVTRSDEFWPEIQSPRKDPRGGKLAAYLSGFAAS